MRLSFTHLARKSWWRFDPSLRDGRLNIHLQSEFRKILARECARADRTGLQFALVSFDTVKNQDGHAMHDELVKLLKNRIRQSDDLGRLANNRIGVLLHNTNAENALRFVESVKKCALEAISNLNYRVYVYPVEKPDGTGASAGFRQKQKLSRSSLLHASGDQPGAPASGSTTSLSMKGKSAPATTTATGRLDFGNIKILLLRVPLWKRILDITGATIALTIFSPVFLVVAIYIKCVSRGPVFFRQARLGYGGEVFRMWKFRTMHTDADQGSHQQLIGDLLKNNDEPMKKLANDPRIIPLGNFLRKFCIDELPQLINVLTGEMSLVGPRPDPVYAIDDYSNWYAARFDVTPGMTGLWQVSGKNRLSFQQMMRLDITYARQWSFWLDLKILLSTLPAILFNAKYDA